MPDLFTCAPRPGTYNYGFAPDHMHGGLFTSLLTAEAHIPTMTTRPWEYEPRRVTWQERESYKFTSGLYTHVPFIHEEWYTPYPEHFLHISLDDPSKVAFTENPEKGERDIQQRMTPGRYLQKFYTCGPADTRPEPRTPLTPKQIAFAAEWFVTQLKPINQHGGAVQFATTPEMIVDVYKRGPNSCMRHSSSVEVYGAGDLAIAYIEDGDRVISRALCWPEKKIFGRVYPTPEGYWSSDGYNSPEASQAVQDDLRNRLRKMGFTSTREGANFHGARLLKTEEDGYFVGPYLDDDGNYPTNPGGAYLIIGPQPDYGVGVGRETSGFFHEDATRDDDDDDDDSWTCDFCDDRYSDHESSYTVSSAWVEGIGATGEYYYCRHCRDHNTFRCEATQTHYNTHNTAQTEVLVEYHFTDGFHREDWVSAYAEVHAILCPETSEWICLNSAVELADGTLVSPEADWFTDPKDGLNYLEATA